MPKFDSSQGYDVAVIGAGSAGFSAAITAAEEGAQVALIGEGTIGGTCVNVGCVPSKALIRVAEALHAGPSAGRFNGITASTHVTDWSAVVRQKRDLIDTLRQAKYSDILPAYESITYVDGGASFSANGSLTVDGEPLLQIMVQCAQCAFEQRRGDGIADRP